MSSISYYAVIPSWVLSHISLSPSEKLMCALISAMSQKNGYCFATNEALAKALSVSESSVKHVLSNLETANVIAIHNKKTKKAGNRQIRLVFAERIEEDEEIQETPELPRNEIEDAFDRFYEVYPRKEQKISALKMFKSKKLHKKIKDLIAAAKVYAEKKSETDKQYILLPSSFLNNKVWEEYIYEAEEVKKISNGAAVPVDPFDVIIDKLSVIAKKLFNSLGVDGVNAAELSAYEFDEKEKVFIESAGGFVVVLRNALGGDFKAMYRPVWESVG